MLQLKYNGKNYDLNLLESITRDLPLEKWIIEEKYFRIALTEHSDSILQLIEKIDYETLQGISFCNLNKPILVKDKDILTIEGYYETCKAFLECRKYIFCKKITEDDLKKAEI